MGSKPSLADAMAKVVDARGPRYRADLVMRNLGDEGALLESWLRDPSITSGSIELALANHAEQTGADVTVSASAIDMWRKKNGVT